MADFEAHPHRAVRVAAASSSPVEVTLSIVISPNCNAEADLHWLIARRIAYELLTITDEIAAAGSGKRSEKTASA